MLEYFIIPSLLKVSDEPEVKYFNFNFIGIFTIFKDQNPKFYILFFTSIILSFCYYICNIFVIYNYSPFLVILADIIIPIDSDIFDDIIFKTNNDHQQIEIRKRFGIQLIGYAIIFLASLIFNEIIVLNFFGFSKNIYLNISKRSREDTISLLNITSENDSTINNSDDK